MLISFAFPRFMHQSPEMKEDHYTAVTRSRIIRRLRVQDPMAYFPVKVQI
jgi:hypothetical protein